MSAIVLALLNALKPHWKGILGGSVLFLSGGVLGYRLNHPTPPVTVQQAQQQVKQLWDTVHAVDTVVTVQTRILTHRLAVTDTLHDTLVAHPELIHDTVWVKQEVQACDSLRSACTDYRITAAQKFHADSLLIGALGRENAAWKGARPSFGSTLKLTLLGAAAGLLADRIAVHNHH